MKVSIIGCGNLGGSFTEGILKSGGLKPSEITVSDVDEKKIEKIGKLGVKTTTDNRRAVRESEVIFLAVKPDTVDDVLDGLEISEDKLLISLAAGVSTDFLRERTDARIIRVMPNICAGLTEMASAYATTESSTEEDEEFLENLLNQMGCAVKVDENLMDAVTGLSGSGPAYVLLVVKALKEAGEDLGISEGDSLKLAAQTVKGTGEWVLNSDETIDELIDRVCSPKGTTIEGVKVLKDEKIEESLKRAVRSAAERSQELSK
ncbi:hypothetical protein AKJ65_01900 [candidate division MSBL1 archaeon SCGC-AAA259E19]|uniref:Pyrroline-5-carboxylate reductase n=1 Tax=candidate division MSBL1 archaeon SCGC-AAA259E19 TaxID=1698264 RepID=A0A133UMC1_9EURY|nr:hypothetical protein AKJ65_01900 [candidate division MSBL1 archaeon SCGC-AAA259E19]